MHNETKLVNKLKHRDTEYIATVNVLEVRLTTMQINALLVQASIFIMPGLKRPKSKPNETDAVRIASLNFLNCNFFLVARFIFVITYFCKYGT